MATVKANNIFRFCINQLNIDEKEAITYILLEDAYGITKTDILLNKVFNLKQELLEGQLKRLNAQEPIQQIVGFTYFSSRKFKVSKDVLIPRPETEEIIDLVKDFDSPKPSIIDIGTGSGCIAITLALEIPNATVSALDVSKNALKIAKQNAEDLKANVTFIEADFLSYDEGNFDMIVSNPPYIKNSEREEMSKNVLDFEPALALFVEDENPLIFYTTLAKYGKKHLNKEGFICVEINSYLGQETKEVFIQEGFRDVKLIKDFYDKDRFVTAKS
ncbi:peptide chain release factor N(5)-glutamine methyltransferase [uncultured Arcticibacterium sp.]|uniref:peptide chain release factor N(5)-glutamine methyltransferase n=1 Tax=uncultured Arcticibacterium sp. TaxID=2173042 RepID=UPI0030F843B3